VKLPFSGITNYPIGVGINSAGEIAIADNHNNFNLTVFNQDGQVIENICVTLFDALNCVTLFDALNCVTLFDTFKIIISDWWYPNSEPVFS
jgi:hypothetical protein